MDLNRAAMLVRVVEAGSFSAAADGLGLRKSTVSRAVAALEDELGVRLLHRNTRRLALTGAGRAFHDRAREALAHLEEAARAAASEGEAPRGLVRLTAMAGVGSQLAPILDRFLREHPAVRLELVVTARRVDLVAEGLDLAVRAGQLDDSSLVARKLVDGELGLFAAPAYLERAGRPQRLADLARHQCLLFRAGGAADTWRLTGPRGEEAVEVHGRVDADDLELVRDLALEGMGIALAPVHLLAGLAAEGRLERVLPRHARHGASLHLVWPSRSHEPAAVTRLRELLAAELPGRFLAARRGAARAAKG